MKTVFLISFAMAAGATSPLYAQSIFLNSITGSDPSTSNPYVSGQVVDSNMTANGIGRGTGLTAAVGDDRYNASSWNTSSRDADAYFTFTLSPNAEHEIDFASFVYTGQASGTGPTNFSLSSSLDGFVAAYGSPSPSGTTIDLSSIALQNVSGPIEFRFYGWGASSAAGTFSINSFVFNGVVTPIPEPSAVATLLLGGLGWIITHRFKAARGSL